MSKIEVSFISGLIEGKSINATSMQNYNHYYIESETLFNHHHDGQDSQILNNAINIGTCTVDTINVNEYQSITSLVYIWESEWISVNGGQKKTINHGLGTQPLFIELFHTQDTTTSPIDMAQWHYDRFRVGRDSSARGEQRLLEVSVQNIDDSKLDIYLGEKRMTDPDQMDDQGRCNSMSTGTGYIKLILFR
jgi:hypothetical protein